MILLEWLMSDWKEKSIFEKIGRVAAAIIFITYTIVLPTLFFIALWLEG